jgi:hypothetical protein
MQEKHRFACRRLMPASFSIFCINWVEFVKVIQEPIWGTSDGYIDSCF